MFAEIGRGTPILIATGNRHKAAEIRTVLDRFSLTNLTPGEAQEKLSLPPLANPEESGASFAENALIKARTFSSWSGLPALGDDSGLEVSALGGRPGIFSARYGGEGLTDAQRIELLLRELKQAGTGDRSARFVCSVVLFCPNGETVSAEGELPGRVLHDCRGSGGFGYDPIIEIDALGKTLAEIDFSLTCEVGFRAQAVTRFVEKLEALGG